MPDAPASSRQQMFLLPFQRYSPPSPPSDRLFGLWDWPSVVQPKIYILNKLLCLAIRTRCATLTVLIMSLNAQLQIKYNFVPGQTLTLGLVCFCAVSSSLSGLLNHSVLSTLCVWYKEKYTIQKYTSTLYLWKYNHLKDVCYFSVMLRKLTFINHSFIFYSWIF